MTKNGGYIKEIIIDNLDNKSNNFSIITQAGNKGENGIENNTNPNLISNPGDIYIENLKTGSYFPNTLKLINSQDNPDYNKRFIKINGCYVNSVDNIDIVADKLEFYSVYEDNDPILSELHNADYLTFVPYQTNKSCIECESFSLTNQNRRIDEDYSLYSTQNGTLEDIYIYYANNNGKEKHLIYNPKLNENYPVYKYSGTVQAQDSNYSGIYKYTLNKENFIYYGDWWNGIRQLDNDEIPFCYAQEYFIKAELNGTQIEFPFTPIFKLW
jgi:hypothetical protein